MVPVLNCYSEQGLSHRLSQIASPKGFFLLLSWCYNILQAVEDLRVGSCAIYYLPRTHWGWSKRLSECRKNGNTTVNTVLKTGKYYWSQSSGPMSPVESPSTSSTLSLSPSFYTEPVVIERVLDSDIRKLTYILDMLPNSFVTLAKWLHISESRFFHL